MNNNAVSFTTAVWKRCGGDIELAAAEYIDVNLRHLDICRFTYDEQEIDEMSEWLRVSCEVSLDGGFYGFSINGITVMAG